ncbi:diguanylate cyclase [Vibrio sp. JC009]|uniref:GGDEF domain-containing response regulator n=1 Tax=Vibrio sp. JC009 TaxID=2912314 RepID=UPI0023B134BA|nr:diguanylate cyclase [Vibrio sp. JC009]WED24504.1 diguanylate cyclase [Vibrio sp. JC009]
MHNDKPRILVVDDEKFNRTILTGLLKEEYTITLAKDGLQALEKARSDHPPELILMDVVMPQMDGYSACYELKKSAKTKDIPVIFITAMHEADDEKRGLDLGAIDYIGKPFRPGIVQARVRNHIALAKARRKLAEAHALLEMKNEQLEVMASRDSLTGICNRFSLDESLNKELNQAERYGRSFSVIIMDIDHFKKVNDTFGHQVGDETLKTIAGLLKNGVRQSDICGRWGGEEFLIICPESGSDGAFVLAEHLRAKIKAYPMPTSKNITASFGIASFQRGESANSLLTRADRALYYAKTEGRNRTRIEEKMKENCC